MITNRSFWIELVQRVSAPVLKNAAQRTLVKNLPIKAPAKAFHPFDRTYLEAIGRCLCGITPWFEANVSSDEHKIQQEYLQLSHDTIVSICDPSSPDYHAFNSQNQFLVDAAFLSHALIRSPHALVGSFSHQERQLIIDELKRCRELKAHENNWLLFAALVECGIDILGEQAEFKAVEYAIQRHQEWYVGDGTYGDGPNYHWDYYNSFVILPMLVDCCDYFKEKNTRCSEYLNVTQEHLRRYASVQERFVAPDGTYPVIGRSIAYRSGAFQALAQAALQDNLDQHISMGQARCALSAVLDKTLGDDRNYDEDGWLELGLVGKQIDIVEGYLSTGSMYLCNAIFLPLGLDHDHAFWSEPDCDWTSKKAWAGQRITIDHAI